MDKHFHATLHRACHQFSRLGLNLIIINKMGPWWRTQWCFCGISLVHLFSNVNFAIVYFRCGANIRSPDGILFNTLFIIYLFVIFTFCAVSYTLLWVTVRTSHRRTSGIRASSNNLGLSRTAKVMTMFVAMYGLQWVPYFIYSIWQMVSTPHIIMIYVVTILSNLGGVFNYYSYSYMRLKYTNRSTSSGSDTVYTISCKK